MGEGSTRRDWLLAASLASLGWAVFVHVDPPSFYFLGPGFCLAWLWLSWKALGAPRQLISRPIGRELLLGGVLGLGMVGASVAVAWGLCADSGLAICRPVETLTLRAREVSAWALVGVGLIIVPAEEVFWHGAVQTALRSRVGQLARAGLSTAFLCLSYLLVGEWELVLAALPTFLVWGLLTEWRQDLVAPLTCHALWTVLSILLLGGMLN